MHGEITLQTGVATSGAMGDSLSFDSPTEARYRVRIIPLSPETRLAYGQPQGESLYKVTFQGAVTVARENQRLKWTSNSDMILIPVDPQYSSDALDRTTCVIVREEIS